MSAKPNRDTLQMLLIAFIERGEWKRLKRALAFQLFIDAARSLHENSALFGANILHIALRNGPPIGIIRIILQEFPETPCMSDSIGRLPLHVACSVSISSKIVATIAEAYPQACMKQDLDLRTPLHFACDTSRMLYEENMNYPDERHLNISTVLCLVSIAPSSVHVEDCDEMNAIEIALLSNAKGKVISLLQHVSVFEHRKKNGKLEEGTAIQSWKELVEKVLYAKGSTEDTEEAKSFS